MADMELGHLRQPAGLPDRRICQTVKLGLASREPFIGNWAIAAKTYWYAMLDNETSPLLLLAAAGLVCLMAREWRTKRTAARSLPVLSLLVIVPFFIVSLYPASARCTSCR